jgi:broad specificity phosphatase PhoE
MSTRTIVHLMRHGEVHNPDGVLYGRLPEYFLSDLGHQMAEAVADFLSKNEIIHLVASPLERAQQTAEPLAKILEVPITTDERVIEADNLFEGRTFGVGDGALRRPANWWKLRNPFRPSWGEPYAHIATRMRAAIADAREAARGHEAVIVSHQLPVWIARRSFEEKSFFHDPRKRECALASLTSLTFDDDHFDGFTYSEPAGHLIPEALRKKFVGGA